MPTISPIAGIIDLLKAESPSLYASRPIQKRRVTGFCKFCACFLSLDREQPTGFHQRQVDGTVLYVVVYYGKSYCRACHKFQAES